MKEVFADSVFHSFAHQIKHNPHYISGYALTGAKGMGMVLLVRVYRNVPRYDQIELSVISHGCRGVLFQRAG
ncbi:unnamed protein product [Rhizopus stolonifer]